MTWEEKKGGRCRYIGAYRVWVIRERFKARGDWLWQVQHCGRHGRLTGCAHGWNRTLRAGMFVGAAVATMLSNMDLAREGAK